MNRLVRPLIALTPLAGLAMAITPALAVTGGDLDVLVSGAYTCEVGGDAGDLDTAAGRIIPEAGFTVFADSSYHADGGGRGVYLLTGDRVVMTTGPYRGRAFHRIETRLLHALNADGSDGEMRCVRSAQVAVAHKDAGDTRCARQSAHTALALPEAGDRRRSC